MCSEDIENEQYREAHDAQFRRADDEMVRKQTGTYYFDAHLHVAREAIKDFMPGFDQLRVRKKPLRIVK